MKSLIKHTDKKQQQIYVKSKVSKNFAQVPYQILDAANISPAARLLWMFLESNSDEFFPNTDAISTSLGLSNPTILKAKKTLLKHNMIFIRTELNARKAEKHLLYTQDPSAWVGVVYKNARSKPTDKETLPVTSKETLPVTSKETLLANREGNIEKIDSRQEAPTDVGKKTGTKEQPAKKATTNLSLREFYPLINEVTGCEEPGVKNPYFQDSLNRLGVERFQKGLRAAAGIGLKFVSEETEERHVLSYGTLHDVLQALLREMALGRCEPPKARCE